jgi:glycosyltransferase involved in cell wall biosynthesis
MEYPGIHQDPVPHKSHPDEKIRKVKKLRILIFSSLSSNSGCYLRAKYLGDALARQGHDVRVVQPPVSWPFMLDMLFTLFRYFFIALFTKFDFGFGIKPYPNTVLPLLIKKFFDRKCRIGIDIDDVDYGYRTGLIPFISKIVQLPFPRHFDVVTYHNDNLFHYIQREFRVDRSKLFRLDQGVDFNVFKSEPKSATAFRKELVLRYNLFPGKILVYTAHLNIASDLDAILDAFVIASGRDPRIRLLIAGGGPMFGYFRTLAFQKGLDKYVVFSGDLKSREVRNYVAAADVCLVYYKDKEVNHYRTSMKIREYLAMGKRVAANDVGDLKEFGPYVFQSKTALDDYASCILKALAAVKDKRHLKGAKFIRKKYDWDLIASKFSVKIKAL